MKRIALDIRVLLAAYAILVLAGIASHPLRLDEILRLAATKTGSYRGVIDWVRQSPNATPLWDLLEYPVTQALGSSLWAVRALPVLFALAAGFLFWMLTGLAGIQQRSLAVVLFLLLPLNLRYAAQALPLEQGMFLLVLASICYLKLVEQPGVRRATLYAIVLAGCLYTAPFSYLPAAGYLIFLFAFSADKQKRKALWYALPATALPILCFLPYAVGTNLPVNPHWLYGAENITFSTDAYPAIFRQLSGGGATGYALSALLLVGAGVAGWRSFKLSVAALSKRVALFCLLGGVVSTVATVLVVDANTGTYFNPEQLLWTAPALCILLVAALDWLQQKGRVGALGLAAVVLMLCVYRNVELANTRGDDFAALAAQAPPLLTGDSCAVFVSEGLSPTIFEYFEPALATHECKNFFHRRVVLLSHPYVHPDQQQDGESFFRGLNFVETKEIHSGGGEIVVMEAQN